MQIVSKPRRIALCAAFLLCASLSVASRAEDAKAVTAWSVPPLLPSDTLAVITVRDVKKMSAKLQQTGIWQIISNPDVQRAFSAPLMQAQFGMAAAEMKLNVRIPDIASYFSQGEITIAVLGVDKRNAQGQPMPDVLVSIQALDKAQAMMEEINKRIDQLKAAFGGNLPITQVQAGNVVINQITLPLPDQPLTFSFALADGNIIAAVGEGRIEKLLAMREAAKADAQAPILAQVPSFKKALEKAGPDCDVLAFVNLESLLKNPILDIKPRNDAEKAGWDAAGLKSIRAFSYCSGVKGKGIREAFFIDVPAADRKGILGLVEDEGLDAAALCAAPRNSIFATAFKVTPEKLFEKVLDIATTQVPNAREQVNTFALMAGQQLNLDIKKEVFNALSGQAVFSISIPARSSKLAIGFPQPLLIIGIKDVPALKNTLSALRKAVQDNLTFSELSDGEHELVVAREKFPQGPQAGQIAYTVDKNDLIVSLYPMALREELRRRAGGGNPNLAGSLADDPDFVAARANLTGKPQALAYIDTGALATAAYSVLIPVAQLAPRPPEVDLNALPTPDVIFQNLGGTVFDFGSDADGIMAEGYSPTGSFSLMAPAIAFGVTRRGAMRAGGGFNGNNQRPMANQRQANQRQDVMQNVGSALKAYAAENAGNYPPALKDLQAKQLGALNADKLTGIVYRGKQDGENKAVAHTPEKLPGPVAVLLQSGAVVQVRRDKLAGVLEKGYTPDAAAAPAQPGPGTEQDAVKPPKPPEF